MKQTKQVLIALVYVAILLFFTQLIGQEKMDTKKIVIIDPRHGGIDSGAVGINGIEEKAVVLQIAKNIVELNKKLTSSKLDIYLTRYSDTLISLSDRTRLAKSLKADLFISLHCNQSENPNAKGVEVFAPKQNGEYSSHSVFMGYTIEKALSTIIGIKSRGVKFANFQVLREMVDYCPVVLVEFGFLSNWDEANFLSLQDSGNSIALVIILSIIKIFGL